MYTVTFLEGHNVHRVRFLGLGAAKRFTNGLRCVWTLHDNITGRQLDQDKILA